MADVLIIGHSISKSINYDYINAALGTSKTWENKGVSGSVTYQTLDNLPADLAAVNPTEVIMHAGENDLASTPIKTWAEIFGNYDEMLALIVAAGATLQVTEMLPGLNVEPIEAMECNWRMRIWCIENNIKMAPMYYYYLDPESERWLNPAYSGDGIHPEDKEIYSLRQIYADVPKLGINWGTDSYPYTNNISWQRGSKSANTRTLYNDDTGKMAIPYNEDFKSYAYFVGRGNKRINLTPDYYDKPAKIYYRLSDTFFRTFDSSPAWSIYTGPFETENLFIQIKFEGR